MKTRMRIKVQFHELPGQSYRRWVGPNRWEPHYARACSPECPGGHADPSEWHHGVYEAIDSAGRILYIGRSKTVSTRLRTHQRSAPWWPDAARFLVTLMPCYPQSKYHERVRIAAAQPLFNVPEADSIRRGIETRKRNLAAKAAS